MNPRFKALNTYRIGAPEWLSMEERYLLNNAFLVD
jgi:hypothetical protein